MTNWIECTYIGKKSDIGLTGEFNLKMKMPEGLIKNKNGVIILTCFGVILGPTKIRMFNRAKYFSRLYTAKIIALEGHEQKQQIMGKIIHQILKNYKFRKLVHLKSSGQELRNLERQVAVSFSQETSNFWYQGNESWQPIDFVVITWGKIRCWIDWRVSLPKQHSLRFYRKKYGDINLTFFRITMRPMKLWRFDTTTTARMSFFYRGEAVLLRKDPVKLLNNVAISIQFYTPLE